MLDKTKRIELATTAVDAIQQLVKDFDVVLSIGIDRKPSSVAAVKIQQGVEYSYVEIYEDDFEIKTGVITFNNLEDDYVILEQIEMGEYELEMDGDE